MADEDERAYWHKSARAVLEAALPMAVARDGWQSAKTMPREPGTRIRALVESELVMQEFIPAALMGGWKRCADHDRIVGWQPTDDATAIRTSQEGERG